MNKAGNEEIIVQQARLKEWKRRQARRRKAERQDNKHALRVLAFQISDNINAMEDKS